MRDNVNLSILIPAYNEAVELPETLARVRAAVESVGWSDWELIVCDNNSTDDTADIAARSGARVVFEPHNQIARARNRAAGEARGEWLLFIDADTRLSPDLLAAALRAMARTDIAGGGAPVMFAEPPPRIARGLTALWNRVSLRLNWAAGCFLFCRRIAWIETGGFDEGFYASEEIWFSRRLQRWARRHGQRFRVMAAPAVVTSGRKFRWYSPARMLGHLLLLSVPGAVRVRALCRLWYKRPVSKI
ncbi:MAG: glycosyltransferase [Elusimicrobia bacterium]|jgi:glycosyltransferase involved in cell wall biosynthesis|nr:glycosyltransferase [Elusimicrobiota bacterium]MBK7208671.1 glycosyltransferase [Elusimicrobiota bacterium]MBK7545414.1 glycosyltransferase [Elusimicrobiota bacterium]MBK7575569.1 glycosyltransferase [Elusimicrobiota bacterium]MBK7688479.1 glycosyltransferase [Elusimicrobiota bacterium]